MKESNKSAVSLKIESFNLPCLFTKPLSLIKIKGSSLKILLPLPSFFFFRKRGWVINHGRLIDSFFELTTNLPLSLNWQSICLFLRIFSQFASFLKCTFKCILCTRQTIKINKKLNHLFSVLCTVYAVKCIVYSVYYEVYCVHCILFSVLCAVHTVFCIDYTALYRV